MFVVKEKILEIVIGEFKWFNNEDLYIMENVWLLFCYF